MFQSSSSHAWRCSFRPATSVPSRLHLFHRHFFACKFAGAKRSSEMLGHRKICALFSRVLDQRAFSASELDHYSFWRSACTIHYSFGSYPFWINSVICLALPVRQRKTPHAEFGCAVFWVSHRRHQFRAKIWKMAKTRFFCCALGNDLISLEIGAA